VCARARVCVVKLYDLHKQINSISRCIAVVNEQLLIDFLLYYSWNSEGTHFKFQLEDLFIYLRSCTLEVNFLLRAGRRTLWLTNITEILR
jgi:hypothetical protein